MQFTTSIDTDVYIYIYIYIYIMWQPGEIGGEILNKMRRPRAK